MNTLIRQFVILTFAAALVLTTAAAASAQALKYDASEGGWVDKKLKLVWGLDYSIFTTTSPDGWGGRSPIPVDYYTAESMAANYPELLAESGWGEAAVIAAYWRAQGYAWRQPTIEEAYSAYKRGLLGNEIGWLDQSYEKRWTSTPSNDGTSQYVISLYVGDVYLKPRDGLAFPLFVRPLEP